MVNTDGDELGLLLIQLFVDPGTAQLREDLTRPHHLRQQRPTARPYLDLQPPPLPEPRRAGRVYSELAASWLWGIALRGLLFWIDTVRKQRKRFAAKADATKTPRRTSPRSRTVWLHGTTGTVMFVAFMFLSVAALTWPANAGANINTLRTALDWTTPTLKQHSPGRLQQQAGPGRAASPGRSPFRARLRYSIR
ncbi:PepSY-associated TM helix domain-containing protein [Paenarthrobacter sp. NPDC018779]|uniref:PepSY-associated TM helix domain-containing protein n=1 Tax=Paenarthrobacter sp. NPDC018779 TaxID=3364375 RepID=UPI0037C661B8